MRNRAGRAGADHLAHLDAARQYEAAGGRADVEPADAGAGGAELGLGDADAGRGGVAGGALAVEIGLADEAARNQRLGPVELVLGELQVGARHLDLGGELLRLLGLDRAVDHRQRLAGADPLAGLDQHTLDLAALAGDADRHVAAGGERAGRRDQGGNVLAAGDDHRHRRKLLALVGLGRCGLLAAAAEHEDGQNRDQRHGQDGDDDPLAPAAPGELLLPDGDVVDRVTAPFRRLVVHRFHRPHSDNTAAAAPSGAVLARIDHLEQAIITGAPLLAPGAREPALYNRL